MGVTGPGWASGARAALDLLGLGSRSGAAARLEFFSRQPPDWRIEVTCPAGNAEALTLELFPPAEDRRRWLEHHGIAIAYRMLSGAVDPRGHPEAAAVLEDLERSFARPEAATSAAVLIAALERSESSEEAVTGRTPWLAGLLDTYNEAPLPGPDEDAFHAAWDIGLLDAVRASPGIAVAQLAVACATSERAITPLADLLVASGVLQIDGPGYRLEPVADRLLVRHRAVLESRREQRSRWKDLSTWLRRGGPGEDPPAAAWEGLIRGLAAVQASAFDGMLDEVRRFELGGARRMLDVGCGSGLQAAAFLTVYPDLHVTLVDYPPALAVAREALAERRLLDRADFVEAEFFDPAWRPPPGHDVAWFSNTMHVRDRDVNRSLFRRLYEALAPGGTTIIAERQRDPGSLRTSRAAMGWFLMCPGGRAYSGDEIVALLESVGFRVVEVLDPHAPVCTVVAVKDRARA